MRNTVTQAERQALVPLPQQLARWAELAEIRPPALPAAAEHPTGDLAPCIAARADRTVGIDSAGHGHGMVSGTSPPFEEP